MSVTNRNIIGWNPLLKRFELLMRPQVAIRVKRMFPRASAGRAGWINLADTPEVARDLEWLMSRYDFELHDDATGHRIKVRAEDHRGLEETRLAILEGHRSIDGLRAPAEPARDYQRIAADLAYATGRLLIADELGLGKTFTSLLLLRSPDALPALVVTPTHLPRQWARQVERFFPWLTTHIAKSTKPYSVAADVLLVPYSKLAGWSDHLAGQVATVIFDEVQELRHPGTLKWHAAEHIASDARYKVGLSATPVYNYGGEIHTIFEVLAPGELGTREEFLREWGASDYNGKLKVRDPAALGTYLRDEGLMIRRTRADVGRELPQEPVRIEQNVPSDPKVIDQVAGDVAAMAQLLLTAGADRNEKWQAAGEMDWRLRHATGVAKAKYVAEFVKMLLESEEKIVLAGWHRDVYAIWLEALAEYSPVMYTGSESPKQKADAVDAFIDGISRVLILSLRSGAGLDGLQEAASTLVFGELDWSPAMHDQVIGRLARDGQDAEVVAYYLTTDDGSDPVIADVLEIKRQQGEPIRDPSAPVLATTDKSADRTRLLAEAVLARTKGNR